jgi:predicted RNase H-like nuclease (RuvC/YqgF family)
MNAVIAREKPLTDDSRITNLEVNLQHLQSDLTETKRTVDWLREAFESFRVEVAKEFGALRTEIERAKLWMVVTGLGTILSVWGAAFALARFLKP